jgi:hypothetical protein
MNKIIVIMLTILLASCASTTQRTRMDEKHAHEHGEFTKHYEKSLFKISDKGMYSVEMVLKEHALKTGVNAVDIIIHDKEDNDVVGGDIEVVPWMPEMGHGVFEKPVIKEKGGGLYTVENIILIMSGYWELRVIIIEGGMEDKAVFDFRNVTIDKGHEQKTISAPDDLDLSAEKRTENGVFNVSYTSSLEPMPINKIHSWELVVNTPEGNPVSGADISLDGDMPEHGHGLPTQPEVTAELENGKYLVEGLKFSMPGWWVIKFNVRAGGRSDIVKFNLLLTE